MSVSEDGLLEEFLDALLDDDPVALYERAPCGYLSTTADGTILKVNQTFAALAGCDSAKLVGRRFAELLTRGGQIYHETHYAPMLRMHGAAREIALDLLRPDGRRLPVLVNSVVETNAAGSPVLIRTAVFDATQRRQYERELLAAKERAQASEAEAVALARTLQQTLIPPAVPWIPHLDVAAEYRPAGDGSEVGGDFYDIFQVADGDWVVAIGDVAGKGVAAAVVTALVRWGVRAAVVEHESPRAALLTVNESLFGHDTERFCTVALVRLTRIDGAWIATVCAAGHDLPLLRKADGTTNGVGRTGVVLGVMREPLLHDVPVLLADGDSLLLYTDGVSEGRHRGEFYGENRILAAVAREHGSAAELAAGLLADVLEFQAGHARDDIAIVAIRVP